MVTMLDGVLVLFSVVAVAVGFVAGWYERGKHDQGEW